MHSLSITIPAYNEAGSIKKVVDKARTIAQEVIVVDDGSTDGTGDIVKRIPGVTLITHKTNQGFSGAIRSCYRNATKDIIFLLPADGQIDPADCALFLKKIEHADVVVGYRKNNPESLSRQLNSKIFHLIYRALFGVKLKEISTSILWRKTVLDSIEITANPRSALIEPEVIFKAWSAGFRFAEVGIPYYPRKTGQPKGSNPFMILVTIKELIRLYISSRLLIHTPALNPDRNHEDRILPH